MLTPTGRRVLDGEDDRVALLGIDRWVGGTQLVPGAVWRWDGEQRSLVAPGLNRADSSAHNRHRAVSHT